MTTRRLLFAVVAVVLGLAVVFLLPRKPGVGEAGIRLELPDRVGDWEGRDVEVSPREREDRQSSLLMPRRKRDTFAHR